MALFNTSYKNTNNNSSINTGGLFGGMYKNSKSNSTTTKSKFGIFTNYSQYMGIVRWQDIIGKPDFNSLISTPSLQQVTDIGYSTTNSIQIYHVNMMGTGVLLDPDGFIALSNTISLGYLKNSNTIYNITLEFPNKVAGTYTIATTGDIPSLTGYATETWVQSQGYLTSAITSLNGTTNRIVTSGNTIDISTNYVGQSSITTLGTIGTGVWNGTVVTGTYGGTGVNNGSRTITIAGNVAFTGANNVSFTTIGAYTYTLPSATSTLLQTSSELTVSFGVTTSNLTITSAGSGYPFHTNLYRAGKVGGNGLVINIIERVANTWDILGMYSEANYILGYKSGSTYNNFLYMVGGAAPYGYIGYATTNPSSTDSIGSRIFVAVNGGLSISSVAGGILSNTALTAIYASTGKNSQAGDLYLAARNAGNGTTSGAELHLITQGIKRVTVFWSGQTEFVGATQHPIVTKSANYTLTDLDHTVEFTAAATATLPDIVTSTTVPTKNSGRIYVIINNSASSVTISRNTAGQIWNQGTAANTFTLTTNKTAIIQAGAGTDYRILSVY